MSQADLSIVLPVLNEEENLRKLFPSLLPVLDSLGCKYEVLVVDGGSTDESADLAKSFSARVLRQRRPGYGGAIREGIAEAAGSYLVTLDADLSHPPEIITRLWAHREKADAVVASRYCLTGSSSAETSRKVLSVVLNRFFAAALSVPIADFSGNFRLYRRQILRPADYNSETFAIVPEILVRAYCDGFSIAEVPYNYERRGSGRSHAQILRFGTTYLQTLWFLWKIRNSLAAADYDDRAFNSRIFFQRYWQRKRHQLVLKSLDRSAPTLDIGCGSSKIIQHLPNGIAFDIAFRKLRFLRNRCKHRVCGSAFKLPFADGTFDQVIHSQVLEHIPFDKSLFTELKRVLRPNGIAVVGTLDYGRIWWPIIEFFYGRLLPNTYSDKRITHYTRKMLIDLLADLGFRVKGYDYICGGELIVTVQLAESE